MRKRGVLATEIQVQVPFHEIDVMEVVWHGHYVKYLQVARDALLARIGYGYDAMRADGFAWPVVDMQLRYVRPAVLGQLLTVRAELIEWESRVLINYLVSDAQSGTRLTRATTTQVALNVAAREMLFITPEPLVRAIEGALAAQTEA
ncbi:MAG: acyl-CoA thioesterase [Pseudomonadales bacterium]|jgi:acyl-CoA thioester hydrolase|nr:acyl-CoA thioesterase [Pseudomonadales bacterium]